MAKKRFEWRHIDQHTSDLDWEEVEAVDEYFAAKAAADQWDQEDRMMLRDGAARVFEVRDEQGKTTRWTVWGEAQPYYYATANTEIAS